MKRHDGTAGNLLCPPSLKRSSLPHANFLPGFYTPSSPISYSFLSIFQEIPHTVHEQAQLFSSPAFPQGSPCQHIPRVPHHRSQSRGSRGAAVGDPQGEFLHGGRGMPVLPGSPIPAGPGAGPRCPRGSPAFPAEGAQRTRMVDTGEHTGMSPVTPPCGLQMLRNLLAQPHAVPRDPVPVPP